MVLREKRNEKSEIPGSWSNLFRAGEVNPGHAKNTVLYRRTAPPYDDERGRLQGYAVLAVSKAKSD